MASTNLPVELSQLIATDLEGDRRSLLAFAHTCSTNLWAIRPLLYRSFTNFTYESTHIKFLTSVTKNQQLACYVRTFHTDAVVHYGKQPLWDLMVEALQLMTSLKELSIRVLGGPASSLVNNCPIQLETLIWNSHLDEDGLPLFLANQHSLKTLEWVCDKVPTRLPAGACPKLQKLRGGHFTHLALLPGRNITHVSWAKGQYDPPLAKCALVRPEDETGPPAALILAFRQILVMEIDSFWDRGPALSDMRYMTSLRFLEVKEGRVGVSHLEHLDVVSALPKLRHLIIHPPMGFYLYTVARNMHIRCSERLFGSSTSLVLFEAGYRIQRHGSESTVYRRFRKGHIQEESLPLDEILSHRARCTSLISVSGECGLCWPAR